MWNKIKLKSKIGIGGMGEVWLASHADFGVDVVVKILKNELIRPKDFKRFQREIMILKEISHPNIVKLLDYSNDSNKLGYAMEYCAKGSLESDKEKFIGNEKNCMNFFWQIASALEFMHNYNPTILHRDIKPSNILIHESGNVKLSDFGLSRSDDYLRVTSTNSNWISVGFSPPEQYTNFANTDSTGDIYSLAASFFYLYTGKIYDIDIGHYDKSEKKILENENLEYIMSKCLSTHRRFASVEEMRNCWFALNNVSIELSSFFEMNSNEQFEFIKKFKEFQYENDSLWWNARNFFWKLSQEAQTEELRKEARSAFLKIKSSVHF